MPRTTKFRMKPERGVWVLIGYAPAGRGGLRKASVLRVSGAELKSTLKNEQALNSLGIRSHPGEHI